MLREGDRGQDKHHEDNSLGKEAASSRSILLLTPFPSSLPSLKPPQPAGNAVSGYLRSWKPV